VGEWDGVPEDIREKMFKVGLMDVGAGKSFMEIDDETVESCRNSKKFCGEVVEYARALAQNIKDNGADFEETWAAFMALSTMVESISKGSYVLFAYLMAEQVFGDEAGRDR
jgi:hypothetical protein